MAKARALDKRRKSIRNIRKITRTMELIATARYKKAMDRATAATAYTRRITQVVADLANAGLEVSHPLLEALADRPGRVMSRAQLEERLYGWDEEIASNAVEVHIHALRRKLDPALIRNVRGLGYSLATET